MSLELINEVTLNLDGGSIVQKFNVKQGNNLANIFLVSIIHNEKIISLDGLSARYCVKRPNGTQGLYDAVIENNKIKIKFTQEDLSECGLLSCEIIISENDTVVFTSIFYVNVLINLLQEEKVKQSDEYQSVISCLDNAKETINDIRLLERKISENECLRESKEITRIENENTRQQNEIQRISLFDQLEYKSESIIEENKIQTQNAKIQADYAKTQADRILNSDYSTLETQLDIERKRIDNIASLPAGGTTGDAELRDIRVDYTGKTWDNAGGAFRGVTSKFIKEFSDLTTRKNLFNKNNVFSGFHQNSLGTKYGTKRNQADDDNVFFYSELINVKSNETIHFVSMWSGEYPLYIYEFNKDEILINYFQQYSESFVTQSETRSICISARKSHIDEVIISKYHPDYMFDHNDFVVNSSDIIIKDLPTNLVQDKYLFTGYVMHFDKNYIYPLLPSNNYTISHLLSTHNKEKLYVKNNSDSYCYIAFYDSKNSGSADVKLKLDVKPKTEIQIDISNYNYFMFEILTDKVNELKISFDAICDYDFYSTMMLKNKKIVFDGDSITNGSNITEIVKGIEPNNNKGFPYTIQQICKKSRCYGYAQGGWRIGRKPNELSSTSLLDHIPEYPEDVDIFVLSGGYNDQAQQIALGEIVENKYYTAIYDEYTFIGALESWICQIREKYPLAQIMYVITATRTFPADDDELPTNYDSKGNNVTSLYNTQNQRFKLYFDSIIKVLNKWGIPYIDLRKELGVEGTGEYDQPINMMMWENGGGLHPNKICVDTHIAPKILNKIRNLVCL